MSTRRQKLEEAVRDLTYRGQQLPSGHAAAVVDVVLRALGPVAESGYPGGRTIQEEAQRTADDLLARVKAGEATAEDAYDVKHLHAVQFILSGGGPGSSVTILTEGPAEAGADAVEGTVDYFEAGGMASVPLRNNEAADVLQALTTWPEEG